MSEHRDIEMIKGDLKEAQQELDDCNAEVCFHEMARDEAQGYVKDFTKELEDAQLNN